MNRKLWSICLAIWMLIYGLLAITNIQFQLSGFVMGVLAIAVAVLIVFDR